MADLGFPKFRELPTEIRLDVWRATFIPRLIDWNGELKTGIILGTKMEATAFVFKPSTDMTPPAVLQVCQESREETLKHYELVPRAPLFENKSLIYINYKVDIFWSKESCPLAFMKFLDVPLFRNIALSTSESDERGLAFRLEQKSGDLYFQSLKTVFLIKSEVQPYPRMKGFEFVDSEEIDLDLEFAKSFYETECRKTVERYKSKIVVPIFYTKRLVLDQPNATTTPSSRRAWR